MPTANIRDRASLEAIYPRDAFAIDAASNDRQAVETLHGVRVASAPDENGDFALERAALQAGETPGALFLTPFRRPSPDGGSDGGYERFLDEIVEAATRHGYHPETSPGPGDPRIRGARQ